MPMTWRYPEDLYEELREISFHTRIPINQLLTEATRQWVDREGRDLAKAAQQKGRKP